MRLLSAVALFVATPAFAKRPATKPPVSVPTIAEVVAKEGFTPTPSQSEIYRPGAVLVPNRQGGHDVVVESCIPVEPRVSVMSQSSIATTLAGGVKARQAVVRANVEAQVEKRLSFVDPEQRTLPLGDLLPSDACVARVERAAKLQDLSSAFVVHDVLVAMVKNTICTTSDAAGGVVVLGQAEASAFSECVQESPGQVPLGYKGIPLSRVLSLLDDPVVLAAPVGAEAAAPPAAAMPPPAAQPPRATAPPPAAAKAPPVEDTIEAVAEETDSTDKSPDDATADATEAPPAASEPKPERTPKTPAERARTKRRVSIGIASVSAIAGAAASAAGLSERADIKDGLTSGSMSLSSAKAQMDAVNQKLLMGYTGLGLGVAIGVGGNLIWSADTTAGGASLSLGGAW